MCCYCFRNYIFIYYKSLNVVTWLFFIQLHFKSNRGKKELQKLHICCLFIFTCVFFFAFFSSYGLELLSSVFSFQLKSQSLIFFIFCSFYNVLMSSFFFWRIVLLGKDSWLIVFPFPHLEYVITMSLAFMNSNVVTLYMLSLLSCAFKILCLSSDFDSLIMIYLSPDLFAFILLVLSFLNVQMVFHQIWKVLNNYFFKYPFCYFLCLLSFWNFHYYIYLGTINVFPQISKTLFIFLHSFFLSVL